MVVYLVQHGIAKSNQADPDRPLTEVGREEARNTADFAAERGIRVGAICHSGKTRARETAEIIRAALPGPPIVRRERVAPNDDPAGAAAWLKSAEDGTMLVGHLPHLSRLASLLLAGDADREVIAFRNAGIVALEHGPDGWRVKWILTPELAAPQEVS